MRAVLILLLLASMAYARDRAAGWCEQGGQQVVTPGVANSTTRVQRSYYSCTVTVYNAGTLNLSTIYSDNAGTAKANPFTASTTGYWFFYADNARYDVRLSGGGIATPYTLYDYVLFDSAIAGGIASLEAQTGATQTFTDDTNVTITSAANAHVLGWTGQLSVPRGGTGAATFTSNGVLLGNTAGALAVTAAGAANEVLRVPGGGGAPAFGAVNLAGAAAITGALPLTNGGTGQITKTAAMDGLSPTTTKGDLLVDDGTNVVRYGIGTDNYVLMADSAAGNGLAWKQVTLSSTSVTGVVPIANGGTGQATAILAFNGLSPSTTKGDLIVHDGTNDVRQAVGATAGMVLTVDATQTTGVKWASPVPTCRKDTVAYTNAVFQAAATTADVTLFTLPQYAKMMGVTVKHSVIFSDGGGAMTQVTVSSGKAGTVDFYIAATNIGEATAVADTTFADADIFKSGTMAAAGEAVVAHFIATGANFGTGAATSLVSGSVDIWSCYATIQ